MPEIGQSEHPKVTLAKTLGPTPIIFMGISCLIGGGIFTLLGPAIGLAGPGIFLAMLLGSSVAFLNLQMYLALGTTFPEAGGGYLWVRKGLGNFQGFLAGWFSWFAHAAACGVYALSLGYYFHELLVYVGFGHLGLDQGLTVKLLAIVVILLFGYLNWRGAKFMGKASVYIGVALVAILLFFVTSGFIRTLQAPIVAAANFTPFWPHGWFGILAAASFFYIAFEGSEIQVQAGEETKNPARDMRISLLTSWAVVSVFYLLISFVTVAATYAASGPSWRFLAGLGEGAIVHAAASFMPWGRFLMTLAGFLANLAALNATIFSSSHVSFALARDNNIWSKLSRIHLRNYTPDLAVVISVALIIVMVVFLPLFDVAAAASLLFVLLFLQLNIAGISIHRKFPDVKWKYRVPLYPWLPIAAIVIYAILAASMLRINLTAWMVTAIWLLLGLVNYFAYSVAKGREQFESEIVYEEAMHIGPKVGKRILLPIGPKFAAVELEQLTKTALAIASQTGGEIIALKIREVPPSLQLVEAVDMGRAKQVFENMKVWVEEFNEQMPGWSKDVNFHTLVMVGRDVTETILDVVKMEDCDLLILNWEGYTRTKGAVFGGKIDRILREAQCDLLVVKDPKPPKKLLVAANPKGKNPNLDLVGEIFSALTNYHQPKTELFCVLGSEVPVYFKTDPTPVLEKLGLQAGQFDEIKFTSGKSIIKAILDEAETAAADLVVVGAARLKPFKDIRFGRIPESLARHLGCSLFIVKAYESVPAQFWIRLKKFLAKGRRTI